MENTQYALVNATQHHLASSPSDDKLEYVNPPTSEPFSSFAYTPQDVIDDYKDLLKRAELKVEMESNELLLHGGMDNFAMADDEFFFASQGGGN